MFTIKAVSQATGVSIETLRAWERRYRVVEPRRDPNGRRSYAPEDVIRLRKLHEATQRGHAISKLARFSDAELAELLADGSRRAPQKAASRSFAERMLAAAEDYSPDDCDQALSLALALLPLGQVVTELLSPLLVEVGERWHAGTFTVAQERIVTSSVRKQVSLVLDTFNRMTAGAPLVLATLSDERHELGLLMCALLAASKGVRCHYLGPDLPPADIAMLGEKTGAAAVVISLVRQDVALADPAREQLADLARRLPRHVGLWIGGPGSEELELGALAERIVKLPDYRAFEAQLGTLSAHGR